MKQAKKLESVKKLFQENNNLKEAQVNGGGGRWPGGTSTNTTDPNTGTPASPDPVIKDPVTISL